MDEDIYNDDLPYISNVEWGLSIGLLFLIDLFQFILDLIGIGLVLNSFIDVWVGLSYPFYLRWRGLKLMKPSRAAGLIGTFVFEMIPAVNALPLWGLDGIVNLAIYKGEVAKAKLLKSTKKKDSNIIPFRQRIASRNIQTDEDQSLAA